MKNFITDLPFIRVCYCRYGFDYKKATRIWTNVEGFDPLWCNHKVHKDAIGCTRTGAKKPLKGHRPTIHSYNLPLNEKYSMPPELLRELLVCCI